MLREVIPAWEVRVLSLKPHPHWGVLEVVFGPYPDKIMAECCAHYLTGEGVLVTVEESELNPDHMEEP